MPCACKPTPVTFITNNPARCDVTAVCFKHDEIAPGRMVPCDLCDATGRVCDTQADIHAGVWRACWVCKGRRVVYLLDDRVNA